MITVFTPTYNRAFILEKLYQSLLKQSCKEFEWLVVDDGSSDNTKKIISEWKERSNGFEIKYIFQENGGKHRAVNNGIRHAKGYLFFIVDSDDFLPEDAIEWILEKYAEISNDSRISGICGNKTFIRTNGTICGELPLEHTYEDLTLYEMRDRYDRMNKRLGDRAFVYKTEVLKRYPFPEVYFEKFMPENVVWHAIANDGLKIRWFNKGIYYADYLDDGYTCRMMQLLRDNPLGWASLIALDKKHYGINAVQVKRSLLSFYSENYERMTEQQFCRYLNISHEEYADLSESDKRVCSHIQSFLKEHNVRSIAIYGFGVVGNKLKRYFDRIGIRVIYAIDKEKRTTSSMKVYHPDDNLPYVDGVCVALRYYDEELISHIQCKLPNTYVWGVNAFFDKIW